MYFSVLPTSGDGWTSEERLELEVGPESDAIARRKGMRAFKNWDLFEISLVDEVVGNCDHVLSACASHSRVVQWRLE